MRAFVAHAPADRDLAVALYHDLARAGVAVMLDYEHRDDAAWWDMLMATIRECDLFIFAVSANSLRSRACGAQLAYAVSLQRPLLPVLVRDVPLELAPPVIANTQLVDYRSRTIEMGIALAVAVSSAPAAPPLPVLLPPQPERPTGYDGPAPVMASFVQPVLYPRATLMFILAAISTVAFPILSIPVLIFATRALKLIDAQPGRFANRDTVVFARRLSVLGCVWLVIGTGFAALLVYELLQPG
jgi:TIR domain